MIGVFCFPFIIAHTTQQWFLNRPTLTLDNIFLAEPTYLQSNVLKITIIFGMANCNHSLTWDVRVVWLAMSTILAEFLKKFFCCDSEFEELNKASRRTAGRNLTQLCRVLPRLLSIASSFPPFSRRFCHIFPPFSRHRFFVVFAMSAFLA